MWSSSEVCSLNWSRSAGKTCKYYITNGLNIHNTVQVVLTECTSLHVLKLCIEGDRKWAIFRAWIRAVIHYRTERHVRSRRKQHLYFNSFTFIYFPLHFRLFLCFIYIYLQYIIFYFLSPLKCEHRIVIFWYYLIGN